jgi:hypothetical protein
MKKLFVTGTPVTGKELIGRDKELKEITHLLQIGQSVILIAPRRFGKTSLLLTALAYLKNKGYYVADVDLFGIVDKRKLAEKITASSLENKKIFKFGAKLKQGISELFKNIQFKQVIQDFEFVLKFMEPNINPDDLLDNALNFPQELAEKDKKDFFFFYDEFGDIGKFDGEELLKLMRTKFQHHQRVCYLFAGSHESIMKEIFGEKKSAFYKFGRIIKLDEIPQEEFTKYISRKFNEENISITDKIIKQLLYKTKCHPYYTQLLCQHIYYLVKGEKNIVKHDDIITGYENAFFSESTYLEKMWEEMSSAPAQLNLLMKIAKGCKKLYSLENENGINVTRSIKSMLKKGIIHKKGENYIIIDPFFQEYLIRNS